MKMGALVLGYHGCDRDIGESLVRGDTNFRSSQNDHDWLGHGIYFWENNPQRAMDWARFMAGHPIFKKRVKRPYAVGAVIDLGNCLDLTEAISLGLVTEAYQGLQRIFQTAGQELPVNHAATASDEDLVRRNLDCAVINYLHEVRKTMQLPEFETVRGAFQEGTPLYPGAGIRTKTHLQIAVRRPENILGVFRIREQLG